MPRPPRVRRSPGLLLTLFLVGLAACDAPFDTVIAGGTIIDGSGSEAFVADIGIRGDRIEAIGDLARARADRVIDAGPLHVAPGFIDLHTHADADERGDLRVAGPPDGHATSDGRGRINAGRGPSRSGPRPLEPLPPPSGISR